MTNNKKRAEQGKAEAQYRLALHYEYGLDVKKDMSKAVIWYRKAAIQGHALAQNNLGQCYAYGVGVEKDV